MAVSLDVQKKINKRRKVVDPVEFTEHHEKARRFLEGVEDVALWMSGAVIAMLADTLDDFHVNSEQRSSFQRCCRRMLSSAAGREERVMFFHEAVPGFTVLMVKKEGWGEALGSPKSSSSKTSSAKNGQPQHHVASHDQLDEARDDAVHSIIGAYVKRTGNRVMTIDGSDVTMILFPVSDLKKNLQEMGFFST